tara:strand:- start:1175 stop:1363 length:189 start_codon:yes stop_codon:yes gene_type:complete
MEDLTNTFRQKLSGQAELCARKALEWLQKDLQNLQQLDPKDVYYLATAADILLTMRDKYGKK